VRDSRHPAVGAQWADEEIRPLRLDQFGPGPSIETSRTGGVCRFGAHLNLVGVRVFPKKDAGLKNLPCNASGVADIRAGRL
jgi:hypothetical protein